MTWNTSIRQIHRWLSIAFTAGVVTYIVAMSGMKNGGQPPVWMGLLALVPLILLLFSGLYLFVLPYAARRRTGRSAARQEQRS